MAERVVARVVRAHGLAGEVALMPTTSIPEARFAPGATLKEKDGDRILTVASTRPQKNMLLVRFAEVNDRTEAEAIRGMLLTGTEDLPPPEDEIWADEVIGFGVRSEAGDDYGVVVAINDGPAHDFLVVGRPDGTESLVPLVDEIVLEIDAETRTVLLDPPEGLL